MREDFVGVKVALFYEGKLIVFLRDNKDGLPFANMWDFPGGGREDNETPFECVRREVHEEFGIKNLEETAVAYTKEYPSMKDPSRRAYFMVANVSREQFDSIVFGDEGQKWELMSAEEFLSRDDAVPHIN